MTAALLMAAFSSNAQATNVPTFLLVVTKHGPDGKVPVTEFGNGFVVQDWRSAAPERYLLVTAAHVLHRSVSVQVLEVNCEAAGPSEPEKLVWAIPEGTPILIWPRHDLAAIPIGEARGPRHLLKRKGTIGRVGFDKARPPEKSEVTLDATSSVSPCQNGFGKVIGYPSAYMMARTLAGGVDPAGPTVFGSMGFEVPLIEYVSTGAPGASGAAVTAATDGATVIAVHLAGLTNRNESWGVLLVGLRDALTAQSVSTRLGDREWQGYSEPAFAQSAELIPPVVRQRTRPWVPGWGEMEIAPFFETGFGSHAYDRAPWGAFLAWTLRRWFAATPSVSYGARFLGGYRNAAYRERYLAPDGQQLFEIRRELQQALVGVSPEVVLFPFATARPALGIGVRLSLTGLEPGDWSVAFPVHARVSLSLSGRWSVALEAFVAPENSPSPYLRYTGIGSVIDERERGWNGIAGLALSVQR